MASPIAGVASLASLAGPGAGNGPSSRPDLSADGQVVVFASDATNLVTGDANGHRDIFVRDRKRGVTRLVSVAPSGAPANGASDRPTISEDGRFVAFVSAASNLIAGDTNGVADVFRVDLRTGRIVRVSVTDGERQANGPSEGPQISGNGSLVVFGSAAANLVARDSNGVGDIFKRDIAAGRTTRISLMDTGDQLGAQSTLAAISPNGSYVGFRGKSGVVPAFFEWSRRSGRVSVINEAEYSDLLLTVASDRGVSFATFYTNPNTGEKSITVTVRRESDQDAIITWEAWYENNWPRGRVGGFALSRMAGYVAVSASAPTPKVYLFKLKDGYAQYSLDYPREEPAAVLTTTAGQIALSSDGQVVAFVDSLGQVKAWNCTSGRVSIVSVGR